MDAFNQAGQVVGSQGNVGHEGQPKRMPSPDDVAFQMKHPPEKSVVQVPSVGRMVHYILPDGPCRGQHRAAVIVNDWGVHALDQRIQLQVFTDGGNDGVKYESGLYWATSVLYADPDKQELGSWHWPEYVPAK